jgi:hypothetical protein
MLWDNPIAINKRLLLKFFIGLDFSLAPRPQGTRLKRPRTECHPTFKIEKDLLRNFEIINCIATLPLPPISNRSASTFFVHTDHYYIEKIF